MSVKKILQQWTVQLRDQLAVLRCAARHPDTPRISRWLIVAALAYALSPIDLIPDFIPVLGWIDDLVLVPVLLWLAIRVIPASVWIDSREQVAAAGDQSDSRR